MTDDDLRAALAAADPARSADLDPLTSPRARELLERAMTSDLTDTPAPAPADPDRPSRTPWLAAAAAAVVLAGAGVTYLAVGNNPQPSGGGERVLALPGGDTTTMSCLPVTADVLAQMPVALAATVTSVDGTQVRLAVDRWFRGGDAGTVVLRNNDPDLVALLGATEFTVGQDYLVSASEGTVTVCGFTGPASAELQAVYDQAF